jgi:hypothetical protein
LPERIAQLPPETFALPQNVEILRPKTSGKALDLTEKLPEEKRRNTGLDS